MTNTAINSDLLELLQAEIKPLVDPAEDAIWPSDGPRPAEETAGDAAAESAPKILIVDDEPINIKLARKYLKDEGYTDVISTTEPADAFPLALENEVDAVLLDIMMPAISGLDVLNKLRSDRRTRDIAVIILTSSTDHDTKVRALDLGAIDFLNKPLDPTELMPRLRNVLAFKQHQDYLKNYSERLELEVAKRTAALRAAQTELIRCLARAAEYRDDDTGRHVIRVGRYVELIARALGMPEKTVNLIAQAALLHDIGKIGIADAILRHPGKLAPEERERMQRHCGYGRRIVAQASVAEMDEFMRHTDHGARLLSNSGSPVLKMAARIALTHHERWDGLGYPLGLEGEHIPIEGRITAVADVFDALRTRRPYKPAYPLGKCLEIMEQERGGHFDPAILDAFLTRQSEIVDIQCELAEV